MTKSAETYPWCLTLDLVPDLACMCPPHEYVRDRKTGKERLLFSRTGICGKKAPRKKNGEPRYSAQGGEPLCVKHQTAGDVLELWTEENRKLRNAIPFFPLRTAPTTPKKAEA